MFLFARPLTVYGRASRLPKLLHRYSTSHDANNEGAASARQEALAYLERKKYDMSSVWTQHIAWGDHDSFRHLNNVHYARFAESARIRFMEEMALKVGGEQARQDMLSGQGIGLILKSLYISYRRPVTYPDTLLLSQKPHSLAPTEFALKTIYYSLAQQRPIAYAESVCVWYDYQLLKKCESPQKAKEYLAALASENNPTS